MIYKTSPPTIGMLYCGDLGFSLTELFLKEGYRVVTTDKHRSPATAKRARDSNAEIQKDIADVVSISDIVISLVAPEASVSVAREFVSLGKQIVNDCTFIDANSIGPGQVSEINEIFRHANLSWVDATIHGGAKRIGELGVMYVSGVNAVAISELIRPIMRVSVLSENPGVASAMKQSIAGFSKSLNALFLQSALLAQNHGFLNSFVDEFRQFYPEIFSAISRMLPTFSQHVRRRIVELNNIEQLANENQSLCTLMTAAKDFFAANAEIFESTQMDSDLSSPEKIEQIVKSLAIQ